MLERGEPPLLPGSDAVCVPQHRRRGPRGAGRLVVGGGGPEAWWGGEGGGANEHPPMPCPGLYKRTWWRMGRKPTALAPCNLNFLLPLLNTGGDFVCLWERKVRMRRPILRPRAKAVRQPRYLLRTPSGSATLSPPPSKSAPIELGGSVEPAPWASRASIRSARAACPAADRSATTATAYIANHGKCRGGRRDLARRCNPPPTCVQRHTPKKGTPTFFCSHSWMHSGLPKHRFGLATQWQFSAENESAKLSSGAVNQVELSPSHQQRYANKQFPPVLAPARPRQSTNFLYCINYPLLSLSRTFLLPTSPLPLLQQRGPRECVFRSLLHCAHQFIHFLLSRCNPLAESSLLPKPMLKNPWGGREEGLLNRDLHLLKKSH